MSSNKDAILKKAQGYMAKGQLDKAIREWEKLISESPNDGNIFNTIGDLHLKKKAISQSIDSYLKAAEIYHESGFDLKTIAVFKKILKIDPKRHDVCLKLGDLNAERGLTGNAISDYLTVAKAFSQEGKLLEGIDVYRKIADLDPDNPGIRIKLGEMCIKEGFDKQAAGEFLQGARIYEKALKKKEAEQYFKKALELDPQNEAAKTALESQAGKGGEPAADVKEAAPPEEEIAARAEMEPLEAIEAAVASGDTERAESLLNQLIESEPKNADYRRRLGNLFLQSGKIDQAIPHLKFAFQSLMGHGQADQAAALVKDFLAYSPDDLPSHLMLASALEKMNDRDAAFSEYAFFVEHTASAGDVETARPVYEKIKQWYPGHEKLKRLSPHFEEVAVEAPAAETSAPEAVPMEREAPAIEEEEPLSEHSGSMAPDAVSAEISEPSIAPIPETVPAEMSKPSVESVSPSAPSSPPLEVIGALDLSESKPQETASVNDLFVEGEVYVKYGLKEKALEQFKRILSLDPDHVEARIQLKELYINDGDAPLAAKECVRLAKVLRGTGDEDGYQRYMNEARELDSSLSDLVAEGKEASEQEQDEMEEVLDEASEALGLSGSKSETDLETSAHAVPEVEEEAVAVPEERLSDRQAPAPDEEEYGFAEDLEEADGEPVLEPAEAAETSGKGVEFDEDRGEISLEDELERSFSVLTGDAKAAPKTGKAGPAKTPAKASADSDNVKSEISLEEELEQTFTSLMDTSQVRGRDKQGLETTLPVGPSEDELHHEISLMHDEKEAESRGEEDYETHYNLGIAYSEMGLINEAIQEFQISCQSPSRSVDSRNMLAACYRKKGMTQDAILNLQAALRDSHCTDQERKWVSYDLAAAYEEAGEWAQALDLFNKLYESDPAFKDVGERVESLRKQGESPGRKKRPAAAPTAQEEDVDSIIEQILGDSDSRDVSADPQNRSKKKSRISYL